MDTQDYFDLGPWQRKVTTNSDAAQRWFNRGLNWLYAFNHAEAVACFERALTHDANCAMAYVGIAYASGPFYNCPWVRFTPPEVAKTLSTCTAAMRSAIVLRDSATPCERAIIDAVALKYQSAEPAPLETLMQWHEDAVRALREAHDQFPEDLDLLVLYSESALLRTPRQLWDIHTGEAQPGSSTLEIQDALEPALARMEAGNERHPAVLHLYIHLMEMSHEPHKALRAADMLRGLVPHGGHLLHMPAHIYTLCGDYSQSVELSQKAVVVDDLFLEYEPEHTFYVTSICHDWHLYMYAAMFLGRFRDALHAADHINAMATPHMVENSWPYMASILDSLAAMRSHVFVRFGRWHELAEMPAPGHPELFPVRAAMHTYSRGIALAALKQFPLAEQQRERFRQQVAEIPAGRVMLSNTARDVLAVGAAMLDGELDYHKGNFEPAFAHLREAVHLDDDLNYTEPWAWMHPPRHALGALLLEQGRYDEAQAVYRADLGFDASIPRCVQHPDNVWSLHGLLECVEHKGAELEAGMLRQRLDLALARADVVITSSCGCRGM